MLTVEDARIQSQSFSRRDQAIDTIVLHYTERDLETSLRILRYGGVSAHYLIAVEGTVYKILNDDEVAWHAGVSRWRGRKLINPHSIGIEIVNLNGNIHSYPLGQMTALIDLCHHIMNENPAVMASNIIGHSDIAPRRKLDPGAKFPWQLLAEHGIGLWPLPSSAASIGSEAEIQALLEYCGYARPHGYGLLGESLVLIDDLTAPPAGITEIVPVTTTDILRAFQLHYQPSTATGVADITTMRLVEGLAARQ